jgi:catechol-2,3-dioxygenase
MPVVSLGHINLQARQPLLRQLRDFYVDVLGLVEGPRPSFAVFGYWLYAGDEPIVHLAEGGLDTRRQPGYVAGFSHVAFTCVDHAALITRLESAQVEFRRSVVAETGIAQVFLTDPAGNQVELQFE